MKKYSEYRHASISISDDPLLRKALSVIKHEGVDVIIETGTYKGTGSTRILAETFGTGRYDAKIHTIENNLVFYREAKANLRRFKAVKCHYGDSLSKKEMLDFIRQDEALRNHDHYQDVFIDETIDPVGFYINEIKGRLHRGASRLSFVEYLFKGSDLLPKLIRKNLHLRLLFLLDSAGGIGYLEFLTVLRMMGERNYFILLDDIHHLKHFRSKRLIESDAGFKVIAMSETNGWILARHEVGIAQGNRICR